MESTLIRHRLLAFALAMISTSAYADSVATMGGIAGDVRINQGSQFVQAQAGQAVNAGDRIMAMEGAATSITFSDGCTLDISGGSLVTVPATSTCKGGYAQTQQIAPANGNAVGNVPGGNAAVGNGTTVGRAGSIIDWDYLGTAVIFACVMFCGNENSNNTVSP